MKAIALQTAVCKPILNRGNNQIIVEPEWHLHMSTYITEMAHKNSGNDTQQCGQHLNTTLFRTRAGAEGDVVLMLF